MLDSCVPYVQLFEKTSDERSQMEWKKGRLCPKQVLSNQFWKEVSESSCFRGHFSLIHFWGGSKLDAKCWNLTDFDLTIMHEFGLVMYNDPYLREHQTSSPISVSSTMFHEREEEQQQGTPEVSLTQLEDNQRATRKLCCRTVVGAPGAG